MLIQCLQQYNKSFVFNTTDFINIYFKNVIECGDSVKRNNLIYFLNLEGIYNIAYFY